MLVLLHDDMSLHIPLSLGIIDWLQRTWGDSIWGEHVLSAKNFVTLLGKSKDMDPALFSAGNLFGGEDSGSPLIPPCYVTWL